LAMQSLASIWKAFHEYGCIKAIYTFEAMVWELLNFEFFIVRRLK
jgi:hypothetical protein